MRKSTESWWKQNKLVQKGSKMAKEKIYFLPNGQDFWLHFKSQTLFQQMA